MTFAALAAARAAVEEAKARGETPRARDLLAAMAGPPTLEAALRQEEGGECHVEFHRGCPRLVPGPARFGR